MRAALRLAALAVLGVALVSAPTAPAAADEGYVKYYEVTAGDRGRPESLTELAKRFLNDAGRAGDIYQLNAGRVQPDGKTLAGRQEPLAPGWLLVLPWDAYGPEVQYGRLRPGATGRGCGAATSVSGADSTWAATRLAVDKAWERGRGQGILVAVVDSGVDAGLPELAGRVAAGADLTTGGVRGDTDCLGSGTAMGSVIAADGDAMSGVAPQSTVFPVRIVAETSRTEPATVATGIEVAVSAGARVIALGGYADTRAPAVAAAVESAIAHDVVVVAGAPTGREASGGGRRGLLRVAGVGPDEQPVAEYAAGAVDLTAPGIDVPTLGAGRTGVRSSSGTQYAVAYVAGSAALVRAAWPELDARQVAYRLQATANPGAQAPPTADAGWGMLDPRAAVMVTLAGERARSTPPTPDPGPRRPFLLLLLVAGLAGAALLARHKSLAGAGLLAPRGHRAGTGPSAGRMRRVGAGFLAGRARRVGAEGAGGPRHAGAGGAGRARRAGEGGDVRVRQAGAEGAGGPRHAGAEGAGRTGQAKAGDTSRPGEEDTGRTGQAINGSAGRAGGGR